MLLIPITGLSLTTGIVALVCYTLLILVRNIVTALRGRAADVIEAATGMGYTPAQRFWRVELPIAMPVVVAGLRIATVTTIGLVTITTFIGLGGLGYLIINSRNATLLPDLDLRRRRSCAWSSPWSRTSPCSGSSAA